MAKSEEKLGKYLTRGDVTRSADALRKRINNDIPDSLVPNALYVIINIFDKVKDRFLGDLILTSFFRGFDLNKSVGGSKGSAHCEALALDLDSTDNRMNEEIFVFCLLETCFDQLIWEFGNEKSPSWVHISTKNKEERNRGLVLMSYMTVKDGKDTVAYRSLSIKEQEEMINRVMCRVTKESNSGDLSGTLMRVKAGSGLRMRIEPRLDAYILAVLKNGSEVQMLTHKGDWAFVRCADAGISGWVAYSFIKK